MKRSIYVLCLGFALLVAGCSTPDTRIKQNPEAFDRASPADQQLIREGRVGLGFSPEMVRLALGDPDRVYTRVDANGSNETWSYITYETPEGVILYRGYYHRRFGWGGPFYPYYLDYPYRQEREYFRVVFNAGHVSAIEQQK